MTEAEELIAVRCPACDTYTPRRFDRYGGLQVFIHPKGKGHSPCRILVLPDPVTSDHWMWVCPADERLEDFRLHMMGSPRVRERLLAGLFLNGQRLLGVRAQARAN